MDNNIRFTKTGCVCGKGGDLRVTYMPGGVRSCLSYVSKLMYVTRRRVCVEKLTKVCVYGFFFFFFFGVSTVCSFNLLMYCAFFFSFFFFFSFRSSFYVVRVSYIFLLHHGTR